MTLCIAALCNENDRPTVVISFDRRIETAIAGADIGFKYEPLGLGWGALIAGEVGPARELAQSYGPTLQRAASVPDVELEAVLRTPLYDFRDDLADQHVRQRLAMSLDDFKQHGRAWLPEDVHVQTWYEIRSQTMPVELVLFGWHGDGFHLFKIQSGNLERRDHFAAVGSGQDIAEPALYQRRAHKGDPLGIALYQVYEAQRLGSIAPGVSRSPRAAEFAILQYDEGTLRVRRILNTGREWLAERYKELGPHPLGALELPQDSFKLVNPAPTQQSDQQSGLAALLDPLGPAPDPPNATQ